ncbi:MAG: hypothetical protein AAF480_03835 [Actinomycetota bacterium]
MKKILVSALVLLIVFALVGSAAAAPGDRQRLHDDRSGLVFIGFVDDATAVVQRSTGQIQLLTLADGTTSTIVSDGWGQVSDDGAWLVFVQSVGRSTAMYSMPLPTGPIVQLTPDDIEGGVWEFGFVPGSDHLVYRADIDERHMIELYSVPLSGGPSVKLNRDLPATIDTGGRRGSGGDVRSFVASPAGRVVYVGDARTNNVREVYSVRLDGTGHKRLSGRMVAGGDAMLRLELSPDGTKVAYVADQHTNNQRELFVAPIDGSSRGVKVSGPMIAAGDLPKLSSRGFALDPIHERQAYAFSRDGSRIVYQADARVNDQLELFSVNTDGTDLVRLNPDPPAGGLVQFFAITERGNRVVYAGDVRTNNKRELFSTPIDVRDTTRLSPRLERWGDVNSYWDIHDDVVVFSADVETNGVRAAYTVPADGSDRAMRISGSDDRVTGRYSTRFTPTGEYVVYLNRLPDLRWTTLAVPATGGETTLLRTGRTDMRRSVVSPGGSYMLARSESDFVWLIEMPT